jgi:hypothetical protein
MDKSIAHVGLLIVCATNHSYVHEVGRPGKGGMIRMRINVTLGWPRG